MKTKRKKKDPRREFPPSCTCLDWSYFRERRERPLCPVHRIRELSAREVFVMRRTNRYTER